MRKDQSTYVGIAFVALLTSLAFPHAAYGHEKWFFDAEPYRTHWAQAFKFPQIPSVTLLD